MPPAVERDDMESWAAVERGATPSTGRSARAIMRRFPSVHLVQSPGAAMEALRRLAAGLLASRPHSHSARDIATLFLAVILHHHAAARSALEAAALGRRPDKYHGPPLDDLHTLDASQRAALRACCRIRECGARLTVPQLLAYLEELQLGRLAITSASAARAVVATTAEDTVDAVFCAVERELFWEQIYTHSPPSSVPLSTQARVPTG